MSSQVKSRYYLAVKLELISPLCVSGGDNKLSDHDILRDFDGNPFIPGSTIAGALRNYLGDDEELFGFARGEDGKMSPIFVSDLFLEVEKGTEKDETQYPLQTKIRDQIRVDQWKVPVDGAKFDMEVVEPTVKGRRVGGLLILEVVQYEQKSGENNKGEAVKEKDIIAELYRGLSAIHRGDIRFGHKKNRGYGRMQVSGAWLHTFKMPEERQKWLDTDIRQNYEKGIDVIENCHQEEQDRFLTIKVPLKLKGGISIREYAARKNQPDYVHITSDTVPVIPGTSWNGALRHQSERILRELGCSSVDAMLEDIFGKVEQPSKKTAGAANRSRQSDVIISESILEGLDGNKPVSMKMVRNKIDRFDASTQDHALYSERMVCRCRTTLEIKVRKLAGDEERDWKWKVGVLLLAIEDIRQGYLPIGGQTAIGRGIFSEDGAIDINLLDEVDREECIQAILEREGKDDVEENIG